MLKKNAHYRFANLLLPLGEPDLQTILENSFQEATFGKQEDYYIFKYGNNLDCLCTRQPAGKIGTMFHYIVYEAGSKAAILKMTQGQNLPSLTDMKTINPDEEFIRSQLFQYVRKNHVLFITHNNTVRDGGLNALTINLANLPWKGTKKYGFGLEKKGRKSALKRAAKDGIEYVELGLGDFLSSVDMLLNDNDLKQGPFKSLVKKNRSPKESSALSKIRTKLRIEPGRQWKLSGVKSLLSTVANNTDTSYGEDFAIKLKNGPLLTQDKLVVQKPINVKGNSILLDTTDIAFQLKEAFKYLKKKKLID